MPGRPILRTLLAPLAIAVALAPARGEGAPGRAAALADHPLMPDDSDVGAFPSAALRNSGLLVLSHGDDVGSQGEVGVLLGDRVVGGVFLGRSDGAGDLARRAEVFPGAEIVVPDRIADLVLAFTPIPGQALGLSLGASHALIRTTNGEAGDNGDLATSFGLSLSHSYDGPTGALADTSAGIDVSYFRRTRRFEVTHETPVVAAFDLRHRSLWPVAPRWQVGGSLRLRGDDLGLDMPAAARSARGKAWLFDIEVGPRVRPSERVTLAVSLRFASSWWTVDRLDSPPRRPDQGGLSTSIFPGFRAAAEAHLSDWATARVGFVGGRFARTSETGEGSSATVMDRQLAWTAGLGLTWENLRIDGRLQAALLQDGPDALGGTAPGLFHTISVSYVF